MGIGCRCLKSDCRERDVLTDLESIAFAPSTVDQENSGIASGGASITALYPDSVYLVAVTSVLF